MKEPGNSQTYLTSWKEIAAFFGKGVRTVQRWESTLNLPVRRPAHAISRNIVIAKRTELSAWLQANWEFASRGEPRPPCLQQDARLKELHANLQKFRMLGTRNLTLQREVGNAMSDLLRLCRELQSTRGTDISSRAALPPEPATAGKAQSAAGRQAR